MKAFYILYIIKTIQLQGNSARAMARMRGVSASVCTRHGPGRTRTHQDATKTPKKRGANIFNRRGGTQKKIVFFLGMRHVYLYITRTPYISDKIFFVSLQRQ